MEITQKLSLLGGLSPEQFMRRHWHKKPLLIRQALPAPQGLPSRAELFELAAREEVESRLIMREDQSWSLKRGPLPRRALPALSRPNWTVLVQGVDLHLDAAHDLLQQFRFVPDARLDDLMISWASDGGGVGPHFDSYDVFLLQLQGRRRWRIGRLQDPQLQADMPLKILSNFVPEEEWVLEPGDMLYLPPRWAHDGVAEGECVTASIGFRAPARHELAREVLVRMLEAAESDAEPMLYRDPQQAATATPGALPEGLGDYARAAVAALLEDEASLQCALGEYLTEPKPQVWFDVGEAADLSAGVRLDRRSRMMYDEQHVFFNGESYRAGGRDARLMRTLADRRRLDGREVAQLSADARELLERWADDGWLHPL
ncbi:cupin domain-containing protein [Aquabacterium sp. A7-Y]|uniref:cupin domain-containing protein n=1 Tax=Aquabacterium sp. A7-Y TaxID=1349605 RepID=UPI00223DFF50|nr:cupin domain-containing protein [Aquabacterium sp. A7-Y]MCW7538217.1 cupin domain-containing protein [Aquabacterium sp. A7-Y]